MKKAFGVRLAGVRATSVRAALLLAATAATAGAALPFENIEFWVGEGTNRVAVVLDWGHEDGTPAVRVWGYRWNGDAVAAQAFLAIDEADPKLKMDATAGVGMIKGFTYDAGAETYSGAQEDHYEDTYMYGTYWSLSSAEADGEMRYSNYGAAQLPLVSGGRVGMRWTYYSFDFVTYDYDPGDTSVAEDAAVAAPAPPFAPSDVHFWAGEGTNAAVVVIDWNRPDAASRAWGYRWNGDPVPVARAIADIAREDSRLHYVSSHSQWGTSVDAFGYDRSDVAAAFDAASATASDAGALLATYAGDFYWAQAPGTGADFASVAWTYGGGVDYDRLADGGWYSFKFVNWRTGESAYPSERPVAAESPYAWSVVAADVAADAIYGAPANALGGPSRSVPGWGDIPPTTVNPASPAWGPGRLVTLASATDGDIGGSITVEFDHPVVDDPRNPFGLDFIVFGNALQDLGGNAWFDGVSDPATVRFATGAVVAERGLVEVSADNAKWFSFTNGPWADDFAPTMSHLYDPENPDRLLFGDAAVTNEWWGAPADATRPVDPALSAKDFQGRTLADYARLYDGSAGGTGFDISAFDLPRDAQGRKFIRYVRITTRDPGDDTEVDAVADVAPAPSFRNWVDAHVAFEDRPGYAKSTVCANGAPAFANAAFGLAPDDPAPGAWSIESFDPATRTLSASFAPFASDLVFLRSSAFPTNAVWSPSLPLWTGTDALGRPLLRAQTPDAATEFFRLELHE